MSLNTKRHKTLRGCINAFLRRPEKSPLPNGKWHTSTETLTMCEVVSRARKAGCWGWCENKSVIHLWIDKKADIGQVIDLIAHEIGHTIRPWHKSNKAEERNATRYGTVARQALQLLLEPNPHNDPDQRPEKKQKA